MPGPPHPLFAFAGPLKDLAEGRSDLLRCTRGVRLDGLSLGLQELGHHPATVPGEAGPAAAICIAEYWLEADGDQVLVERSSHPDPDPAVYYYAHEAGTKAARRLAPRLSGWLESLARSPVFRR